MLLEHEYHSCIADMEQRLLETYGYLEKYLSGMSFNDIGDFSVL